MKILHVCLAQFYIDNYGYQENVLPKMHRKQGHDVMILASTETFIDNSVLGYLKANDYINENGIPVRRLDYLSFVPKPLVRKLRVYKGTYNAIVKFQPDIIFLHDVQFLDILYVVRYVKNWPNVIVFADGHTDFGNSARSFISKYILHALIYRFCCKRIEPYIRTFYGTLPARVDFFKEMYGTPPNKTRLLVMGADDDLVIRAKANNSRARIRTKYGVQNGDFLIVTGGKINSGKKQTLALMKAVAGFKITKIKLMIFGSVSTEIQTDFDALLDRKNIFYVGWLHSENIYDYFEAADLIIFPGSHSVLWEQAVGQGKPCLFKYFPGHTHIDLGGNCMFLHSCSKDEISEKVMACIAEYDSMKQVAEKMGLVHFSYNEIAKRAICIDPIN
jgi:1,2-diacylglycerol 3-alpha-glucosyltransferase